MTTFTSRLAIPTPALTDGPADVPAALQARATILDKSAQYITGTAAARGSASASPSGQIWFETDTLRVYISDGSTWHNISRDVEVGMIVDWAGTLGAAPGNYYNCDGANLLRASYALLFAAIGTTWGASDGTHFNLPNLQGSTTIGAGTGPGLTARSVGSYQGAETHLLTAAEMPAHSHTLGHVPLSTVAWTTFGVGSAGGTIIPASAGTISDRTATDATAAGAAHSVMNPSGVVYKLIRFQ